MPRKEIRIAGPDNPIPNEPANAQVRVSLAGKTLAGDRTGFRSWGNCR